MDFTHISYATVTQSKQNNIILTKMTPIIVVFAVMPCIFKSIHLLIKTVVFTILVMQVWVESHQLHVAGDPQGALHWSLWSRGVRKENLLWLVHF